MDFQRDEMSGSKSITPKIGLRRPQSRDGGGILPGLKLGNFNNTQKDRQLEKPQDKDDSFTQSARLNQLIPRQNIQLARNDSRENFGSKALLPKRPQNELLSRDVDKEINNMQVQTRINNSFNNILYNLIKRVRELEGMMIDFKGNIERRIQKIQDDQPIKFMSNFKRLEDKDGQLWKDNNQKQDMLQDQYQIMRETIRKNNEFNGQTLLELQRKIDDVSYQNHKLQKNQEQLQVIQLH